MLRSFFLRGDDMTKLEKLLNMLRGKKALLYGVAMIFPSENRRWILLYPGGPFRKEYSTLGAALEAARKRACTVIVDDGTLED